MSVRIFSYTSDSIFEYFRPVISDRYSVLLSAFWGLVLLTVLAVQVLPYSISLRDIEMTEVIDFEEAETDEQETKEKEQEKRSADNIDPLDDDSRTLFLSSFHYLNGFPIPPYLETLSPPPDQLG